VNIFRAWQHILLREQSFDEKWEDQEKLLNNVDALREEFRRHLFAEAEHTKDEELVKIKLEETKS